MDALKPFTTPGGYRVEFFEQPEIMDRSEFVDYVNPEDMRDPDAEKMLSVPFLVRDDSEDAIGAFIFLTSLQAGNFVVPADEYATGMDEYMRKSGYMDEIMDELEQRFQFSVPKTEPAGPPTQAQLNTVLDKISASGMGSLSDAQRELLGRASSMKENKHIPYMENFVPKFSEFNQLNEDSMARPDVNISAKDDLELQFFWAVKNALQIPENDPSFDEEVHEFVQNYVENHWGMSTEDRRKKFDDFHRATMGPGFDAMNGGIQEKWSGDAEVEQTGQYAKKTIEELKSMRSKLKAKKERSAAESTKLRQINFAIRAKRDWKGGAK